MALGTNIVRKPGAMVVAQEYASVRRTMRRPVHDFFVRHRPFTLQPFLLAPVIPGETLKSAMVQSRAVTHPIKNPLIGWHLEYFFFYVKHRDMPDHAKFSAWMLNPAEDMSQASITSAGESTRYYVNTGGFKWAEQCMQICVEHYFRDEGEAWNVATIDGLPARRFRKNGPFDTLKLKSAIEDLQGGDPSVDPTTMDELDRMMQQYEFLKEMKLVEMSYEDFLRSYGITGPAAAHPRKPELLRYLSEWQYPTNTIDPTNGTPRSAVSWSVRDRLDKDRFFPEPGFVFGITCATPKVYWANQQSAGATWLKSPYSWLPAIMHEHPWSSLVSQPGAGGIAGAITTDYLFDARDLFVYGDQFIAGQSRTAPNEPYNNVALPNATANVRFPDSGMARGVFVTTTDGDDQPNFVRQDGVVQLSILGRQRDMT